MRSFLISSFLIFCIVVSLSPAQKKDTLSIYYYNKGLNAVSNNDLETAKDLFKKSVRKEANAPAEYELAKIYMADTSHSMWNISREHIKNAVVLDPNNATYRTFYGKLSEALFKMSRLELNAEDDAIRQYEKALELDSSNVYASKRLGELKANEFLEFNNSYEKFSTGGDLLGAKGNVQKTLNNRQLGTVRQQQLYDLNNINYSDLNKLAEKDFDYAIKVLINTIKYDSLNPKSYLTLGSIYEDNNQPGKGIKHLQRLTRLVPDNEKGHLELGLLYYRTNKLDSAYSEYKEAINLMSNTERQDFTFNSAKILLHPFLGSKMENINDRTLHQIISIFWKARDPLNITPYNERLLEHYTRVAYANLRFSLPKLNIKGWETDRGITVIRYGIPPKRMRFRPGQIQLSQGDQVDLINISKTDVWIYKDKTFSFTDDLRNGNFKYAKPSNTQYFGDTQEFAKDLLATQPEAYNPEFEGPRINVPYKVIQLNNPERRDLTDLFISYGIKPEKSPGQNVNLNYKHSFGIFFFDSYFNKLAVRDDSVSSISWQNKIEAPDSGNLFVNSVELIAKPDSGNMSFEILRNSDNGVAAYHGHYKIRSFNSKDLILSDIILASDIEIGNKVKGRISRKDYSILPNPTGIFNEDNDLYIYYEIYNLDKDIKGLTDFKQNIILQKKDEDGTLGKIFSPLLKLVGINNEEKKVELTSNYQTKDKDSQVYLQLDMTGYEPGDYVLTIKIKDNITGIETEQRTELTWR